MNDKEVIMQHENGHITLLKFDEMNVIEKAWMDNITSCAGSLVAAQVNKSSIEAEYLTANQPTGDEDWVDGEDRGDDDNSSHGEEYNDEEYDY